MTAETIIQPSPIAKPAADKAAMLDALRALLEPGDVIELRALHKGKKRTDAGCFDAAHWPQLVEHAERLNNQGAAVYVTLNPVNPQLLGRYNNRMQDWASATATDADIMNRRWLLVDIDPKRPRDTSATAAQFEAAKETARSIYQHLAGCGWPAPIVGESGNGMHLLYPLALPNDTASRDLVKAALQGLAARFDTDAVSIDVSVFNAGRITKLYGTVANKGDHTDAAPWRLSRLVSAPERGDTVTVEQLREVAQLRADSDQGNGGIADPYHGGNVSGFDLPAFLERLGIAYDQDTHDGSDRYKLHHCPFNHEHGYGESAVFRRPSGALGFKCQHNSCEGNDWHKLRELVDGPRESRTRPQADVSGLLQGLDQRQHENGAGPQPWADPLPLSAKIEPESYPIDALPTAIRAAVEEVQGFVKAPLPLVAGSALAALSLACQAHIDAKRLEKLSGPVGLFILVIADSGERKSTCDSFFTKTITDYEEAQAEAAKPALKDHKAESEAWEAKRQGIKEKIRQQAREQKPTAGMESALRDLEHDKPEPPRIPRLLYADATPEALAYGLAKQWPSGGVVSAEAGIVFGSHGMGKDSVMRNLGLLNQLWDGKTLTIDRRSTESFSVRGARLTVALQVQEPTLREFFTRSGALARGTGFLARFLVAWPESTQGMRQIDPGAPDGPATWPHLAAFHQRIAEILDQPVPIDDDGALTPALLALAPDAKAAWVEYHNAIESELSSGGELYDVRDVASKSADNAARLAALFQMFEGAGGAIGADAFEGASRITAWHLSEARRFFGELALPAELADAARLDRWLIEHCRRDRTHMVGKNHVRQHGPLRDGARIDAAIRELSDLGRIRLEKDSRRLTIHVNPALLEVAG